MARANRGRKGQVGDGACEVKHIGGVPSSQLGRPLAGCPLNLAARTGA